MTLKTSEFGKHGTIRSRCWSRFESESFCLPKMKNYFSKITTYIVDLHKIWILPETSFLVSDLTQLEVSKNYRCKFKIKTLDETSRSILCSFRLLSIIIINKIFHRRYSSASLVSVLSSRPTFKIEFGRFWFNLLASLLCEHAVN